MLKKQVKNKNILVLLVCIITLNLVFNWNHNRLEIEWLEERWQVEIRTIN
jgi:hypothetical protein